MNKKSMNNKNDEVGPSMEEILTSIRNVINNDDEGDEDILELTEIASENRDADSIDKRTVDKIIKDLVEDSAGEVDLAESALEDMNVVKEKSIANEENILPVEDIPQKSEDASVKSENVASSNEDVFEKSENSPLKNDNVLEEEVYSTPQFKESLISEATAAITSDALKSFKNTVGRVDTSEAVKVRPGITLEELVSELLKPYLSKWLDENLPDLVKDLVKKEIQKLTPGKE